MPYLMATPKTMRTMLDIFINDIAKCGAERRLIKMTNNLFKNNKIFRSSFSCSYELNCTDASAASSNEKETSSSVKHIIHTCVFNNPTKTRQVVLACGFARSWTSKLG